MPPIYYFTAFLYFIFLATYRWYYRTSVLTVEFVIKSLCSWTNDLRLVHFRLWQDISFFFLQNMKTLLSRFLNMLTKIFRGHKEVEKKKRRKNRGKKGGK